MKKSGNFPFAVLILMFSLPVIHQSCYAQAQEYSWKWKSAGTLPKPMSSFAIGIHERRVYIIGGSGSSADVYYASIRGSGRIGKWQAGTSLPEGRIWTSQQEAVVYNNRIYVVGGAADSWPRSTVWYANMNPDGSLGNWISTTPLPDFNFGHITVLWNGRIYVIGGWTGYNWLNKVYSAKINADGSLSSWREECPLPEPRGHDQAGTVYNGVIYELGGQYYPIGTPYKLHNTVYYGKIEPDETVKVWNVATPLPYEMGAHTVSILGNRIYLIGGFYYVGSTVYLNKVYSAQINSDGSLGDWVEESTLPEKRAQHSSIAYEGRIYVFGGVNENGEDTDTIYVLRLRGVDLWESLNKPFPLLDLSF